LGGDVVADHVVAGGIEHARERRPDHAEPDQADDWKSFSSCCHRLYLYRCVNFNR
jgi:hypothetical protein